MHIYGELKAGMKFKWLGKPTKGHEINTGDVFTLAKVPEVSVEGIHFFFSEKSKKTGENLQYVERIGGIKFCDSFLPVGK
jgi:hypothetical protein